MERAHEGGPHEMMEVRPVEVKVNPETGEGMIGVERQPRGIRLPVKAPHMQRASQRPTQRSFSRRQRDMRSTEFRSNKARKQPKARPKVRRSRRSR
jgi:hypothetical protein